MRLSRLFRLLRGGPWRWLMPVAGLALLAACGGGGSSVQPAANGTLYLSINDATGDFSSYAVTINQITLTRDDGVVVKALAAPVQVDLAQLVNVSELFGSASIPSGTYPTMSIDIDYTNADISAENASGQVVTLVPVTQSGAAAGVQTVTIKFTSGDAIVVRQGTPVLASLDFDLAASNTIDFTASPPTVTVAPFLYAVANPAELPYSQASGTLSAVNVAAATYTIDVVPLFYTGTKDFGSLTVGTGAQTSFSIDGKGYVGSAGIQAMAALTAGAPTLAYGTYSPPDGQFDAEEVLAGSSVPGATSDAVHGAVTARSGNTLTVVGLTYVYSTGEELRHSTVTVSIGTNTLVYKAGDPSAQVGIGAISVGQRVTILGTLTNTDPTALAMDAGAQDAGYVRLAPTNADGEVVAINSSQVTLALSELARHPPSWYDFAGTGSTSTLDADPANYQVNTGAIDLSGLTLGEPAEVDGFVQPFGQAPPDFNATTVGNFSTGGARLMVGWHPNGTAAPFSTEDSNLLVINLADPNIGPIAVLRRGGKPVDLSTLPASPLIVPPTSGTGRYAIRRGGTVTIYVSFSAFAGALQTQLNGSTVMIGFFGTGGYDVQSNTFTATRIGVNLK